MYRYSGKNIGIKIFRNTVYTATINKGRAKMSTPPDERFYVFFSQRTRQNIMYIIYLLTLQTRIQNCSNQSITFTYHRFSFCCCV